MIFGTGCMREWYDDGSVKIESEVSAGEAHGCTRTYDINGHVCTTYYWVGKKVTRKRYIEYLNRTELKASGLDS